ncbi:MAG: hypothetical protein IJZ71_06790 [Treponema sp.]|nr:hypothetical protein [Treponema sp.]
MKKIFCMVMIIATLLSVFSISVSAAESSVSYTVGNGEEFTRNTYFDNDRGIISASFSETLVDEAAIKVLHTTKNHYGTVSFSTRNSSTNTATAGNWTNRADVKVDSVGTATYRATYY